MELSRRLDGHSLHLLAYHVDPAHAELAEAASRDRHGPPAPRPGDGRQAARARRGHHLWEQVAAIAGDAVVVTSIARAMAAAGAVASPEQAFTPEWIGPGGRACVSRYALDPEEAIRLVSVGGGVSVLAHPACAPSVGG